MRNNSKHKIDSLCKKWKKVLLPHYTGPFMTITYDLTLLKVAVYDHVI